MFEYAALGLIGAAVMLVASLFSYEVLRFTWGGVTKLPTKRHVRVLLLLFPIFVIHIMCIWLYGAVIYVVSTYTDLGTLTGDSVIGEGPSFLLCLHYSAMVYTTVGFGDVIPTKGLEMLAGIEALNGLVFIGWTVSLTYLSMEKFWNNR